MRGFREPSMNRLPQPEEKHKMLAAYSPSHDHVLSSHLPELKICQWYCCDCGQSHGQILYTDAPSTVPSTTDYLGKLKYYSRVVYDKSQGQNSLQNHSNDHTHTHTHNNNDDDTPHNYLHFQPVPSIDLPPLWPAGDSDNESLESPPTHPHPYLLHIEKASVVKAQRQKMVLNPPSRFTCGRCNHMMCPYCLKIRLLDLG